jgi:phytanoyl-CoA dioxygenase PhyH
VNGRRPESARADDADAIARAFEANGAVHVLGAVDVAVLSRVAEAARAVFVERETLAQEGRLPEALSTDYVRRFIHLEHLQLGSDIARSLMHPVFLEIARSYLEKEPEPAEHSHVRSIQPIRPNTYLPFHQDQAILKKKLLNVWIPLSACGDDAPGLEIVLGSWGELLPVSPPPDARFAVEHATIDEDVVLDRFGRRALWRPVFEFGDAMVFAGTTAHRTYATLGMSRDRMSVELRLV